MTNVKVVRMWLSLVVLLGLLIGCSGSAPQENSSEAGNEGLTIEDVWARPVVPMAEGETEQTSESEGEMDGMGNGVNSAAYMTISNGSTEPDRLIRAEADVSAVVELHETTMENDMMGMRMVEGIDVPADGSASLEPGGYHVMLIDVQQELAVGDTFPLTLTFEKAGERTVQVEVREP